GRWHVTVAVVEGLNLVVIFRLARDRGCEALAKEYESEDGVEFVAALGRRGEGCVGGAADIFHPARTKKADGGDEGLGLLGGDSESVVAQDGGELEERLERARQRLGHAAAPLRSSSRRGSI